MRFEDEGADGLRDRRLGEVSPRRSDAAEIGRMGGLYRDRYRDFTGKHFHEVLVAEHDYKLCYTVTPLALQAAGLLRKGAPRGKHRQKRQRRPLPGMLLFQDGSTHAWLPGTSDKQDLIVTLDDATGHITSIFLTEQEGTMSSFTGLAQTIPRQAQRQHYVRATVCVHEKPDGLLAIFDGPRCLSRFDADGQTITQTIQGAA